MKILRLIIILSIALCFSIKDLKANQIVRLVTPKSGVTFLETTTQLLENALLLDFSTNIRNGIIQPLIAVHALGAKLPDSRQLNSAGLNKFGTEKILNTSSYFNIGIKELSPSMIGLAKRHDVLHIKILSKTVEASVISIIDRIVEDGGKNLIFPYCVLLKSLMDLPYWTTLTLQQERTDLLYNYMGFNYMSFVIGKVFKTRGNTLTERFKLAEEYLRANISEQEAKLLDEFRSELMINALKALAFYKRNLFAQKDKLPQNIEQLFNKNIEWLASAFYALKIIDADQMKMLVMDFDAWAMENLPGIIFIPTRVMDISTKY